MMNFWKRLCNPEVKRKKISDINLDDWKLLYGTRLILIDCDNTICGYKEYDIPEDIVKWGKEAKNKGFKIIIISNNNKSRVAPIAKTLEVEYKAHAFKFLVFPLWRIIKKNKVRPKHTLVVGDQILMDIIPANIIGVNTVLVKPLSLEDSFFTRRISRKLEKFILKRSNLGGGGNENRLSF